MIARWLYNTIKQCGEREALQMNLDFVLDKMGCGTVFSLVDGHPKAVTIEKEERFYIKPSLIDTVQESNSRIILFSAPGATGKSALARHISYTKHALLWDLSMDKIANHSFSGMLVESLGTAVFSQFMNGLVDGTATLVIDAVDEAELISGRAAIETLLLDLRQAALTSVCPNIVLCARTETAHFIRNFYAQNDHKLELSQYEISFFEDTSAIEFIKRKILEKQTVTSATVECIKAQFQEIRRLLDNNDDTFRSFIGYAPVLEALSVFYDEESNTMQLLQKTQKADCSAEIFQKIMDYILKREQRKVINGFKERCQDEYQEFENWNTVYSIEEQLIRLINYVTFNEIDYDVYSNDELPRELKREYIEAIKPFFRDHPFIHLHDSVDGTRADFTGPAFRDYVIARLMTCRKDDLDYDEYAQCYFEDSSHNAHFPSQLFFDLYEFYSDGIMKLPHFRFLYDAFKSKEVASSMSMVCVEQVENSTYCVFEQNAVAKRGGSHVTELCDAKSFGMLQIVQLNNGYIDVEGDVVLGDQCGDVTISNSTIKCRKLIINTPSIMLVAECKGETLICCREGIDSSRCPNPKFEIRADDGSLLKISTPNIDDWFKLRKYKYDMDDDATVDITKFENAVKTILKHFRKHRKDAPGRYKEYIDNIIVGGSPLKKEILEFFLDRGIIYQDSKDPRQYKLEFRRLEVLGVNWGKLSQSAIPDLKEVFYAYSVWQESRSAD